MSEATLTTTQRVPRSAAAASNCISFGRNSSVSTSSPKRTASPAWPAG
jgi:hypothetical protein